MKLLLVFVLVVLAVVLVTGQTNYCALRSCRSSPHIGCRNNGSFAARCRGRARMIDMTSHIEAILNWHNIKRNSIAGGEESRFLTAKRMATMEWDNELASLAELNVKQCRMNHDRCRNTPLFKRAGQNLATIWYTGRENSRTETSLIDSMMQGWWNELIDTTMEHINSYPSASKPKVIGHFTAMLGERQKAIGCACSRWLDPNTNQNHVLLACNMASTNIVGWPTYQTGPSASACTSGRNPSFNNLCSTSETGYNL